MRGNYLRQLLRSRCRLEAEPINIMKVVNGSLSCLLWSESLIFTVFPWIIWRAGGIRRRGRPHVAVRWFSAEECLPIHPVGEGLAPPAVRFCCILPETP